jgi:hypothetical protein
MCKLPQTSQLGHIDLVVDLALNRRREGHDDYLSPTGEPVRALVIGCKVRENLVAVPAPLAFNELDNGAINLIQFVLARGRQLLDTALGTSRFEFELLGKSIGRNIRGMTGGSSCPRVASPRFLNIPLPDLAGNG